MKSLKNVLESILSGQKATLKKGDKLFKTLCPPPKASDFYKNTYKEDGVSFSTLDWKCKELIQLYIGRMKSDHFNIGYKHKDVIGILFDAFDNKTLKVSVYTEDVVIPLRGVGHTAGRISVAALKKECVNACKEIAEKPELLLKLIEFHNSWREQKIAYPLIEPPYMLPEEIMFTKAAENIMNGKN